MQCSCGTKKNHLSCCAPYISGKTVAPTALALMRSRYTAYTLGNIDYIVATQIGPDCKHFDKAAATQWSHQADWIGLKIIAAPTPQHDTAQVHFVATYQINHRIQQLEENSTFQRINGQWRYLLQR